MLLLALAWSAPVAVAAPPPLRPIAAEYWDIAPGVNVKILYAAEMSAGGAVLVHTDRGVWRLDDGVPTHVLSSGDPKPGGGTFGSFLNGTRFAGEDVVFTDGDRGFEVLYRVAPGGTPTRVIGVGDVVSGAPIASIWIDGTDLSGGTLIYDGPRAIYVDRSGAPTLVLTTDTPLPGFPDWTPRGGSLNDEGEITSYVEDDLDQHAVAHGPVGALALTELAGLVPNPYPHPAYGTVGCCVWIAAGATGSQVLQGYDRNAVSEYTLTIFRGLPSALTPAFVIPHGGLALVGSGNRIEAWPFGNTVVGDGGDFAAVGTAYRPSDRAPFDTLLLGAAGEARAVATSGDVADGYALDELMGVCGVTAEHVVFLARDVYDHHGVFAFDRQSHAIEPWWLPGAAVERPDGTSVTALNASCDAPSRTWESGRALVWMSYETAPGSSQFRTILFDSGRSVASLVVNSHDDGPQAGDAKVCDTGRTATNGDPECTLRAALEVANTRGTDATITFDLPTTAPIVTTAPLPEVDVSIEIAGDDGALVEIAPAVTAGSGHGLTLLGATSTLRNLAIRDFSGNGVEAVSDPLTLIACDVTDNGGWGVHNEPGVVEIQHLGAHRSEIARNGLGGLLVVGLDAPTLFLLSADVHHNGGAGAVSNNEIAILSSTLTDNEGPGAAVLLGPGPIPAVGVSIQAGGDGTLTEISRNHGEGIRTVRGGVAIGAPAVLSANGAWGVDAFGHLVLGELPVLPAYRIEVSDNGAGTSCFDIGSDVADLSTVAVPCRGGGLLSAFDTSGGLNVITAADIVDNAGPGVLVGGATTLAGVDISRNAGPGVKRVAVHDGGIDSDGAVLVSFTSTVNDNAGYGISAVLGFVDIQVASEIRGNHGAGIRTESSRVSLTTANDGATGKTVIAENGFGDCVDWDIDASDEGVPTDIPCEIGGIVAPDDAVYGIAAEVVDNHGDGITADTVDLHYMKICGNTGEALVVAGRQILEEVDLCDGGGPGGGGGGTGCVASDGCAQAGPGGGVGWAWAAAALLAAGRRRRS